MSADGSTDRVAGTTPDTSSKYGTVRPDTEGEVAEDRLRPLLARTTSFQKDDIIEIRRMTTNEKFTIFTFCLSNFGIGTFYSLLGPFFPNEAAKQGVNATLIGLIFGVYELVFVLVCPIFGNYLTQIGAKFMFVTGLLSCGFCSVLFGFLDASPPGTPYIVLCFMVRCFEGVGAGGLMTASFAIMAYTFPEKVATMFGTLELFTGLGLMVGPPIGGALFQLGGFRLPFVVSGAVLIILGVITVFTLPSPKETVERTSGTVVALLCTPVVLLAGLLLVCGAGCIGFVDIGLSPILLNVFHLSPLITGLVFLVGPGMYALTTPIWGYVADKTPRTSVYMLVVGSLIGGFSFWILGPATFLHFPSFELWMVIVAQGLMGIGLGTLVVTFQLITDAARNKGYPETLGTYGLVSGVFSSCFSLGAFVGPVAGGALQDGIGFANASTVVGAVTMGSAVLMLSWVLVTRCCLPASDKPYTPPDDSEERERLLADN